VIIVWYRSFCVRWLGFIFFILVIVYLERVPSWQLQYRVPLSSHSVLSAVDVEKNYKNKTSRLKYRVISYFNKSRIINQSPIHKHLSCEIAVLSESVFNLVPRDITCLLFVALGSDFSCLMVCLFLASFL